MTYITINQEALDSQIYNPTTDPVVLQLQQMMEQTTFVPRGKALRPPLVDPATVSPELQQFVTNFNALSPENVFQGVILNPITCLTDEIRDGQDSVNTDMDAILVEAPEYTQEWEDADFDTEYDELNEDLDDVEEHTDRLTSNLSMLAGLAQGALALATVMSLLSNPCLGLDGFLGSISAKGKEIMNTAKDQIKSMVAQVKELKEQIQAGVAGAKALISGLISDVKDAINVAKDVVKGFLDDAKKEILSFAKAMLSSIRQGLNGLLADLNKDPCLKSLLGSVVTGTAAAVIK